MICSVCGMDIETSDLAQVEEYGEREGANWCWSCELAVYKEALERAVPDSNVRDVIVEEARDYVADEYGQEAYDDEE